MKKRNILNINFEQKENTLIGKELKKIDADIQITTLSLDDLNAQTANLSAIGLVLINLKGDTDTDKYLLKQVKNHFVHFPIIVILDAEHINKNSAQYKVENIIDVRPLEPVFLVAKSIEREIKSQQNKYLAHQIISQSKNESFRFESFLRNTEDGVALIHDGIYWSCNQAYKRIFSLPEADDISGTQVKEFSMPTTCSIELESEPNKRNLNTSLEALPDDTTVSVLIQTKDSQSFVTTIYKTHCFVNDKLCTQLLIHNPDAWSNIDKGFTDLRTFDHDTGLYNKRFTLEYVNKELEEPSPHGSLAIILIDEFRSIREQYSDNYIDEVLRLIASIIKSHSSRTDILARFSDATFTLFSGQLTRAEFLIHCQEILTEVNDTLFGNDAQYIKLTVSIGVGFIDSRITTAKQLISQADKACDKACLQGGGQIHVFDSVTTPLKVIIDEEKNARIIQSALEEGRLHPLYQPIVDLSEKSTENYAVLLRILDNKNKHIPPDNFILTAEKTGLISALDEWVLKNTIEQIRETSRQGIKRKFFISLSSVTYRNAAFLETLVSNIKLFNIDASSIVFQINFSDVLTDPTVLKNFISLIKNKCGCQLAFDHTGFTQITDDMLKEYAVDYIKIDGSFSQNLLNNEESQQTIRKIVEVTRRNNVKTIAKSVENSNTLAILWNIGVDAVQGYFLQKPASKMNFDFTHND
ncbi:MAG: GGDEF-domain containing protein [Cycloclasticus sp.]|nr:MAG: GGDEF-domain containing protein [Cycloclasticus sp.]